MRATRFSSYIPFYKRNLKLAVPVMITQAGQIVVQLADNIMVGHLGTAQFAGVSFANTIYLIGFVFCICFTQGLIPHAGQNYGSGNIEKVRSLFYNSTVLNLSVGILITILMTAMLPVMGHMGQDPDILEYARSYYAIMLATIIPIMAFFSMRNLSEGIGITKYAMYITVVANITNIFLNWILIYGKLGFPAMGVNGAAIATLVSRIIMVFAFIYVLHRCGEFSDIVKGIFSCRLNRERLRELLATSIPIGLQGVVEVTAFSISGIMVGWFGKTALAANQIALTMSNSSFTIAQGIGTAATIRVSHQLGEKRYADTRKAGHAAMHIAVIFMATAGLLYITFRKYLPYIFTSDPTVIEIAAQLLIASAAFQVFDALQLTGLASLRGLNDVKFPLYFSIVAYYVISLGCGYIFGFIFNLGPIGVWIGLALGLAASSTLFLLRFNKITERIQGNPSITK